MDVVLARAPRWLPCVLARPEVAAVLARLSGAHALVGLLLDGTGKWRSAEALVAEWRHSAGESVPTTNVRIHVLDRTSYRIQSPTS